MGPDVCKVKRGGRNPSIYFSKRGHEALSVQALATMSEHVSATHSVALFAVNMVKCRAENVRSGIESLGILLNKFAVIAPDSDRAWRAAKSLLHCFTNFIQIAHQSPFNLNLNGVNSKRL